MFKPLSQRQQLFAEQYSEHGDARLAASECGYTWRGAGWRLLRHAGVQEELQRRLDAREEVLSAPDILHELSRIGRDAEQPPTARVRALELLGRRIGLWEAWQHRQGVPPQVLAAEELSVYGDFLDTITIPTAGGGDGQTSPPAVESAPEPSTGCE